MKTSAATKVKRTLLAAVAAAGVGLAHGGAAYAAQCTNCGPGGPPPPPPPSVSRPDMAFQITPCLDAAREKMVVGLLKNGMAGAEDQLDLKNNDPAPNPEVRTTCVSNVETVTCRYSKP